MRKVVFFIAMAAVGVGCLYHMSNWWERAFASFVSSELSPDGCIRVDTYKPFWVLPSFLHRIPHPDPEMPPNPLGMPWPYPEFKRAYEVGTGIFLGETITYDGASALGGMYWNASGEPGRRVVLAGGFALLDSERCADKETMAKLAAYHEQKRLEHPARMKEWDEYERRWKEEEKTREEEGHRLPSPN
ncbi:hypothetical protein [Luteibacter sp.]|uniref:hypothetical protein n=1 Tax=Luteibacter sp. TaxID=1886636 RepID=UPI002F42C94F